MSLDLALLPFAEGRFDPVHQVSWTVLECKLGGVLHTVLGALEESEPVSDEFLSYAPSGGFGCTKRDPYGCVVRCIPALVLLRMREHSAVQGCATNRAVWAYLAELDPEQRVALWWH
jgi:hypothetical protein